MEKDKKLLIIEFNRNIALLIKLLMDNTSNELELSKLDRLKKRITVIKSIMGDEELINIAAPLLISVSDEILNKNEDYFLNTNLKKKAQDKYSIHQDDNFILDLIEVAQKYYVESTIEERNYIYKIICDMLSSSVSYLL